MFGSHLMCETCITSECRCEKKGHWIALCASMHSVFLKEVRCPCPIASCTGYTRVTLIPTNILWTLIGGSGFGE